MWWNLLHFKNGKCLAWDYTCLNSLGPTHIKDFTSKEAGKATSLAEVEQERMWNSFQGDRKSGLFWLLSESIEKD